MPRTGESLLNNDAPSPRLPRSRREKDGFVIFNAVLSSAMLAVSIFFGGKEMVVMQGAYLSNDPKWILWHENTKKRKREKLLKTEGGSKLVEEMQEEADIEAEVMLREPTLANSGARMGANCKLLCSSACCCCVPSSWPQICDGTFDPTPVNGTLRHKLRATPPEDYEKMQLWFKRTCCVACYGFLILFAFAMVVSELALFLWVITLPRPSTCWNATLACTTVSCPGKEQSDGFFAPSCPDCLIGSCAFCTPEQLSKYAGNCAGCWQGVCF
jgi:hypothetical protein